MYRKIFNFTKLLYYNEFYFSILNQNLLQIKKFMGEEMNAKRAINEWLGYKKITSKKSTYYRYTSIINDYVLPAFGNEKITKLEKYNFNDFVLSLSQNLSATTTRNIMTIVKSILQYINDKYDTHIKFNLIALPRANQEEVEIIAEKDRKKLEKHCLDNHSLRDLGIVVCLYTGLRIGEICALQWKDIDFKNKYISVRQTMERVYDVESKKSKVIIDVPKSKYSIRKIPMSTKLYNILISQKDMYDKDSYFLTGSKIKFVEPRNYQYMFAKCLKECKLPHYHFHQLRHTFATNCIKAGMDIKSLSVILGHANVKITLDRYVHSSLSQQRKYLNKI